MEGGRLEGEGTLDEMARYRSFIFDMDGTLVKIPVDWQLVRLDLKQALKTEDQFSPLFGSLLSFLKERPEARGTVFSLIDRREIAAIPASSLIEGAMETLSKLTDRAAITLVTMQGRKACEAILTRFSLSRFFRYYFTREDSLDRSQQLRMAMTRLNAKKNEVLFVGDRLNDVRSAREVGIAVAMITEKESPELDPDHVFPSITEFSRFILD